MKIVMTGSSGFIGSALVPFLEKQGHHIIRLVHKKDNLSEDCRWWDPEHGVLNPADLEGCHAVINLAGESVAGGRWTEQRKRRIHDSRVKATSLLASIIKKLKNPPQTFLTASAIGYYGAHVQGTASEDAPLGEGFLADVCRDWEGAAAPVQDMGIRVVNVRIGVVLDAEGGALQQMLLPFKFGLGGVLGDGNQMVSWISLEDLVRTFQFCLEEASLQGPVNAVAPHPVTNRELTKTLGKLLKRPTILPMPGFMLRLLFGEAADELMLSSADIMPQKLMNAGFVFHTPYLEQALRNTLASH